VCVYGRESERGDVFFGIDRSGAIERHREKMGEGGGLGGGGGSLCSRV
jgi:hypothetical protein